MMQSKKSWPSPRNCQDCVVEMSPISFSREQISIPINQKKTVYSIYSYFKNGIEIILFEKKWGTFQRHSPGNFWEKARIFYSASFLFI
jgi:hypothetical protein